MTKKLSIDAANCFIDWEELVKYSVNFSDGITVIYTYVDDKLEYNCLLSTGLSSSYLTTGKWPNKRSMSSRLKLSQAWFQKNKNRYKILKK